MHREAAGEEAFRPHRVPQLLMLLTLLLPSLLLLLLLLKWS